MSNKDISPSYRNDIDGLRAFAVILVILFHAGFNHLPSGFIGVDVFFAISGFLMTGIIIKDKENGRFSLKDFFIHRLWRIQPALITMSIITLCAATYFYLPEDFIAFLHSAKYNSLFLSNQFFARQSAAYASPSSDLFPLLHTWSLAIEWQWYLFLPLGIYLASYCIQMPALKISVNNKGKALAFSWFFLTAVSVLSVFFFTDHKADDAYYSLLARAFEFLVGGAAFFLTRYVTTLPSLLSHILGILSLAILIYIAVHAGVITAYPNEYALLVVLASSLIMFTGTYGNSITSRILALPPLAYTGRISYSLYLWHWPVFSVARYQGYVLQGSVLYVCFGLTLLLSLLSYYLVEQPCRRFRWPLKFTLPALVIFPVVLFNSAFLTAEHGKGYPGRFGAGYDRVATSLNQALASAGNRPSCLGGAQNPSSCNFGDINGTKSAFLIGDSSSNQYWGFFDVLAKNAHIKMTALSTGSCLALPGLYQFDWWIYHNQPYEECHNNTARYYDMIKRNHFNYVIIGEIWEQYASGPNLINRVGDDRSEALSKERMIKSVHEALNIIVSSGAKPVFIRTISPMPPGYQECIRRHYIHHTPYVKSECDSQNPHGTEDAWTLSLFDQLKKEYPSLLIIDPKSVQCQGGICITAIDGIPLYRDIGHLVDFASFDFGKRYLNVYGNPF